MRRFVLMRHHDVTGVSGEGVIAHGVEFGDGTCAVHWHGDFPCTQVWPSISAARQENGVNGVRVIHGHSGRTVVRWIDAFSQAEEN